MSEVSSLIELNDQDILSVEKVVQRLQTKYRRRQSIDAFVRECAERFADIGLEVKVNVLQDRDDPDYYEFSIEIVGRLEGEFDPDQMVHEVTNNLLGIGESGFVKTDWKAMKEKANHGGHGHQHSSGLWLP